MRDLLHDPAWQAADLGSPLPDSPHAVSVAMPRWQDVIDYEEERPRVTTALRCGYPRFFCHPRVMDLVHEAERQFAMDGECCLVFPTQTAAERCREFIEARVAQKVRLEILKLAAPGAVAVVMPGSCRKLARLCWRYCGETVSSRLAGHLLAGRSGEDTGPLIAAGGTATRLVRERLAGFAGVGADDVFLFTSGMAGVFAVHRAVQEIHPGRPTLQLDFPYVDVLKVQEEFGSGVKFFPVADEAATAEVNVLAAGGAISGVFCEMPSNPLLRCVRLSRFAPALRQHGIPLIVDDTIAGVTSISALRFADVVTTSLTKAFSGAGDVMAGAVTLNPASPFYANFSALLRAEMENNSLLWCEDATVLEANSRDFPERAARMSVNAASLAAWLERHHAVEAVYYPRGDDGFEEIALDGAGHGCLLSVVLKNPAAAPQFYDRLRVSKGPSLGTNFTLCCPYTLLAHYTELAWAASCGVRSDLIRVSAGLEDADDLIARFAEALE